MSGDWAWGKTAVKATGELSLRHEAGGGGKKIKLVVALPQRKGNDSEGRAHGRRQWWPRCTKPRAGSRGCGEEG
ncbi:hypothetical protein [Acetobacterium wieringae]|uniref:hypothetical protein n=1 Tax=Acetobacterium wieringae TaxID=52694 RepID=UPI0011DF9A68|nr:hypothetical protein [Acetobacterium wieringae]